MIVKGKIIHGWGTGTKMDNTDFGKNHEKAWDLPKMYNKMRSVDLLLVQEGVIYCDNLQKSSSDHN